MKKIISTLCFLSFSTAIFATPQGIISPQMKQQQMLRSQRQAAEEHIKKVLNAQSIEELKFITAKDLERKIPQVREGLVQLWRNGNEKRLSEIYDQISKKDPHYISRVIGVDRNSSLDKSTAMLHLYSMASIPQMLKVMSEDIAKIGGLKSFQAKLKQKIKEAEVFNFSNTKASPNSSLLWSNEDCGMFGLVAIGMALSIIFLPVAILMIPLFIFNCS